MRRDWLTSWDAAADHPWITRMFMIGACSVLLLVLEAIVGDLTHWKTTAITAATGATAGLAFAELGLRSSR
jgi:hypothetical protein